MHSFVTASEKDEVNPGDLSDQNQSTQRSRVDKVDALVDALSRRMKMSSPSLSQRPTTHETAGHSVCTNRAGMEIVMRIFPIQYDKV